MKPTILDEIFEKKKGRVRERKSLTDQVALENKALTIRENTASFRLSGALLSPGINIIAEIKRASPSKGIINDNIDAAATALAYQRAGAKAISVLTEEDYFEGSMDDLRAVRDAVGLPILQKDFIFDDFQIYEAAAAGADAVLLIVAMLDDETLGNLYRIAKDQLGMDVLVEVRDQAEMERARNLGARLIGVNNRNLKTFDVSLDTSRKLIRSAPEGAVMVTESGLKNREDILELRKLGFRGFLIGETLMKSEDPEDTLNELIRTTKVKICGITNLEDALFAAEQGADALGFNFFEKSPRWIDVEAAAKITSQLPGETVSVGVFVNKSIGMILDIAVLTGLNAIQLHGNETPEFILELKGKTGLEIIKAVRVSPGFVPRDVLKYKADTILLDAFSKDEYGGTGETFDWTVARQVQSLVPRMYLAGGLSPENIAAAVKTVGPYAVDACSCLERGRGLKDNIKVKAFIEAAKGV